MVYSDEKFQVETNEIAVVDPSGSSRCFKIVCFLSNSVLSPNLRPRLSDVTIRCVINFDRAIDEDKGTFPLNRKYFSSGQNKKFPLNICFILTFLKLFFAFYLSFSLTLIYYLEKLRK